MIGSFVTVVFFLLICLFRRYNSSIYHLRTNIIYFIFRLVVYWLNFLRSEHSFVLIVGTSCNFPCLTRFVEEFFRFFTCFFLRFVRRTKKKKNIVFGLSCYVINTIVVFLSVFVHNNASS